MNDTNLKDLVAMLHDVRDSGKLSPSGTKKMLGDVYGLNRKEAQEVVDAYVTDCKLNEISPPDPSSVKNRKQGWMTMSTMDENLTKEQKINLLKITLIF